MSKIIARLILSALLGAVLFTTFETVFAHKSSENAGIPPQIAADYIHTIIDAHRRVYSEYIVDRLSKSISLPATENWEHENTLLLPAQFLLTSSQIANKQSIGVSYRLLSPWPINQKNFPRSELEKIGLKAVINNPDDPFTWIVSKGPLRYFQAIYPDFAVTESCVSCHNNHPKSPKSDFKMGEVMGGIFINLPLGKNTGSGDNQEILLKPEVVADYLHSILESHRYVYSKYIVDRLKNNNVLPATENWLEENALLLPVQFLQNTARVIKNKGLGLDFRLISLRPINPLNGPANEFERIGLESVEIHPVLPFRRYTRLREKNYFQAIYPDLAVSQGCASCHNAHPKSPKKDYKLNDVMGGIVVSLSPN